MEQACVIETTLFFSQMMGLNSGRAPNGCGEGEFGNTRVTLSPGDRCFISIRLR